MLLKQLRTQKGLSLEELAKHLDTNTSTLSRIENGKQEPKSDFLRKCSEFFNLPVDFITGDLNFGTMDGMPHGEKHDYTDEDRIAYLKSKNYDKELIRKFFHFEFHDDGDATVTEIITPAVDKVRKIHVLGRISAGMPITATENILDFEEISMDMASLGEHFALQVRGSSMAPRIIDGDIVIVRKQSDVNSGDIAAVFVDGKDATLKKIIKTDSGIMLQSFNPEFQPIFYTPNEIKTLPVEILGKVVELRGKF